MAADRILVKGGYVVSMDPGIGDLPTGDVLIEGNTITAVAPSIEADAEVIDAQYDIVLPGMVDTHRHTWQSLLRGLYADASILEFFASLRLHFNAQYTAEDAYVANYIGALDAIENGVTTILDYSHCIHTPEHADALVGGLRDAGLRAVYAYGLVMSHGEGGAFVSQEERFADARRIAETYCSADDGLLTRGVALTELGLVPFPQSAAEVRFAIEELDAIMVMHTGAVAGTEMAHGIRELAYHKLLSPKQVHVHCCHLDGEEWRLLADCGCKVSMSPDTELGMAQGLPPIRSVLDHGIKPTLSCDITSMVSGDLLTQARFAALFGRAMDNQPHLDKGTTPATMTISSRDALEWATINGAEACGLADRVGSLTPGKKADVLLVGCETMGMIPRPHAVGSAVFQANAGNIHTVLVDGRVAKRDGKLVGVDFAKVREMATKASEGLFERAGQTGAVFPPVPPGFLEMMNPMWSANIAQAGLPG